VRDASGERVDIYEFSDKEKLIRVIAHEARHSLGLGHNDNPQVYYYDQARLEPDCRRHAALQRRPAGSK